MKLTVLAVVLPLLLSGCGQSEQEKYYERANKEAEAAKYRREADNCIRDNRINKTNVDCNKKYPPLPKE
ncbi:MAG: conjugal transfer protein TraH [Neisseria sp.]|uniref:conjugal transfer protein TraH n=1 Tax=Neisseria sp. TaxID=192066 RepID=UPI00362455DF